MNITRRFNPNIIYRLKKHYVKPVWVNKRFLSDDSNKPEQQINNPINDQSNTKSKEEYENEINYLNNCIKYESALNIRHQGDKFFLGGALFIPLALINPFAIIGSIVCVAKGADLSDNADKIIDNLNKQNNKAIAHCIWQLSIVLLRL